MLHGLARASRMASSRYDSVAMVETGLACEGGFGQRDLSNLSNTLLSGELPKDTLKRALKAGLHVALDRLLVIAATVAGDWST